MNFNWVKTKKLIKKIFINQIWEIPNSEKKIYLTFDDGPTIELTRWILDELQKEKIKASFFCVGENAKNHPELMDEIRAAGHVIGNHTMRHENGSKTSKQAYLDSIEEAEPYTSSTLFRPPYGRMQISFVRPIRKKYKIIMWSWLSYDYDHSISVDNILIEAEKIKAGIELDFPTSFIIKERVNIPRLEKE